MDADEKEIYYFLKSWTHEFISAREICRRAGGKRRSRTEPDWAKPALLRMVERGILETDAAGHFRLKPPARGREKHKRRWASPQIAQILKSSGRNFDDAIIISDQDLDEYYDGL
ncbi:MAG: hypothetical protein KJ070_12830 [Verrucomicrobia bacterium]|nr:hypothetical protein [Verrucomicrobiota bacterium]